MTKPSIESVPVYYRPYIEKLQSDNVMDALDEQFSTLKNTFNKLTNAQLSFAYAEGKWTLKQMLQHLIDAERIMSYRALRFSRGDRLELPGFDQDLYAESPGLIQRSKKSLIEELVVVRNSTKLLFGSLTEEELRKEGIANGYVMSAQNIGFVIAGHAIHHLNVVGLMYTRSPNFPV